MFRVRVLGGFALGGPSGGPTLPLPQRRAEAVLAVLAVCGDLGCTRERLVALLWPESDEAHARHGLRDALHAIRQALGSSALLSAGDLLRLDPAVVVSDVQSFIQALKSDRQADAVPAYGGPLLDGFHVDDAPEFERWLDAERSRLARQYGETLAHLGAAAEQAGVWAEAAGWWARAVEHDPLNSHLVLQQVRALAAIGDRANAIKVADAHARRLREELDLEPDAEVLARIERIRRGEMPAPPGALLRVPAPAADRLPPAQEVPAEPAPQVAPSTGTAPSAVPQRTAPGRYSRRAPWAAGVVALVVLAGIVGLGRRLRTRPVETRHPRTAIAVLPFQNLSADTAHAYFAAGLHDELLAQLAKVAALRVIGRTSVLGYQGTTKPLRQIGAELEVGSIVEGSVQVVGGRLRVIVQLVDPVSQAHLWADRYDRTLGDAFAVQSDIAQQVVDVLGVTLTEAEAGAIRTAPTQNATAYQLYLQALEYHRRPGYRREHIEIAQSLLDRVVALDPGFASAHAALSWVHGRMHYFRYDPSSAHADLAWREARTATRLAPGTPHAYLAMGIAHRVRHDYRRALDAFNAGLRIAPQSADLWWWSAVTHMMLDNPDSALVAFEQARRLDPRNVDLLCDLASLVHRMRRFEQAIEVYRQAIALAPDVASTRVYLAWSYVNWKGELESLRVALRGPPDAKTMGDEYWVHRLLLLWWARQPDSMLATVRAAPAAFIPAYPNVEPRSLWAARAHQLRGDSAAALAALDSAAVVLDSAARASPGDWRVHLTRGQVFALLGRRRDAMREVQWLRESELSRSERWGLGVDILVLLGETGAVLQALEHALTGQSLTTVQTLRLSPSYDRIRSDPRFQALLARYANREAP